MPGPFCCPAIVEYGTPLSEHDELFESFRLYALSIRQEITPMMLEPMLPFIIKLTRGQYDGPPETRLYYQMLNGSIFVPIVTHHIVLNGAGFVKTKAYKNYFCYEPHYKYFLLELFFKPIPQPVESPQANPESLAGSSADSSVSSTELSTGRSESLTDISDAE